MKKHIYILILLLFPSLSAWAQTDLDSLYNTGFGKTVSDTVLRSDHASLSFKPLPGLAWYISFAIDRPPMRKQDPIVRYYGVSSWDTNDVLDHGWFVVKPSAYGGPAKTYGPRFIFGARNEIPLVLIDIHYKQTDGIDYYSWLCLNHGVLFFHSYHFISWQANINEYIHYEEKWRIMFEGLVRYESYEDGVLHGLFSIKENLKGAVIYETEFDHGTGDYLDVFPDGAPRRQGRMVDGYMDGKWYFYARTKNGEYTARIDADFDMGRVCRYSLDEFIDGQWVMKRFVSGSGE